MNEIVRTFTGSRTTRAAAGLPHWRWTTAELLAVAATGAFTAEDRFELIGGEIVPMSPVGRRHEVLAEDLEELLRSKAAGDFRVRLEPQLNLKVDSYTKPDIIVRPKAVRSPDLTGETVLLVIEVADTSLQYDLGPKAGLYARHGVREYWVIDARTLVTRVHRGPGPDGYGDVREVAAGELLVPLSAPTLAVRLADLDLE